MSVKVVCSWEFGWNVPLSEFNLWHFPLRDFGIDTFYMTPISGIDKPGKVEERATLDEVLLENSEYTFVYVDERADVELQNFNHPQNALYIFGKSNNSPFLTYKTEQDMSVKIATSQNLGTLWQHQAASIVLYDRLVKSWR